MKMTKKEVVSYLALGILFFIIASCSPTNNTASTKSKLDGFAECLTNNGVKMYGAYWCPHCSSQKQIFGDSWKYVNYIECSLPNRAGQTQICSDAKIEAYPTWEFQNGKRIEGELSFEQISQNSACELEG